MRRLSVLTSLSILLAVAPVAACSRQKVFAASDAQRAVAEFYAWYSPLANDSVDAAMRAVRDRSTLFPQSLVKALRDDSLASAQSTDEVVGLDGDPFLNSQDPCDKYSPTATTSRAGKFFVDVQGAGGCSAHSEADVIVEVTPVKGRPVFTNFTYSPAARDNLVALLADRAAARR